jgi:hypothetical protein
LTRFADKYGRPVSLAYIGTSDQDDLSLVFVDAARLQGSVNYQLLAQGLVYPTFYSQLYVDLRNANALTAAAQAGSVGGGRHDQRDDQYQHGRPDRPSGDLAQAVRRLAEYFALGAGFLATHDDGRPPPDRPGAGVARR